MSLQRIIDSDPWRLAARWSTRHEFATRPVPPIWCSPAILVLPPVDPPNLLATGACTGAGGCGRGNGQV